MKYVLAELPAVDRVEVIHLARKDQNPGIRNELLEAMQGISVEGEAALEIARLWRALPFAEQMRCHMPPFAVRFFQQEELLLSASICWQCNNIWTHEGQNSRAAEFDADADVSQQLLRLLEEVALSHSPIE